MSLPPALNYKEVLEKKIKVYNDTIWKDKFFDGQLSKWLGNFGNGTTTAESQERLNALYLLSKFMYFGNSEIRESLKSIFRDKFQYTVIQEILSNSRTVDINCVDQDFTSRLNKTRFLGIGNPSESGVHLLYYFRQENNLAKDLFLNAHEIFDIDPLTSKISLTDSTIKQYIFIDDFCGSGQQAIQYSSQIVENILKLDNTIKVSYFPLFATAEAIATIRANTSFSEVDPIFTLDSSYRCFESDTRYFKDCQNEPLIDVTYAKTMCEKHGLNLFPLFPLGYNDCQLLIGFFHNTPDNCLPIFWSETNNWSPFFKRYAKI